MLLHESADLPHPCPVRDIADDFSRLWRRTIRNEVIGSLISVLPAVLFFAVAFSYSRRQLLLLLKLTPAPVAAFLTVDLAANWWFLGPFRRLRQTSASPESTALAWTRLHNLPLFSFARVFGPHALAASVVAQLEVMYANAHWGLGVPSADYWVYWLLNFTLVPIGHAIYEYHANGWAAQEALAKLATQFSFPFDPSGVWRVGLAVRLAIFYTLLAISPLALLAAAVHLRPLHASGSWVAGTDIGLMVAGVTVLNFVLLLLFAIDVNQLNRTLLEGLRRVEKGNFSQRVNLFSPDEFGVISQGVNQMMHGLADRERIRDLFGVYVSPEISQAILEGRVALEGETREVSVLFCDIREFTRFSATRSPREVVSRLNRFFSRMSTTLREHGGTINKFLGDGFLAVFGAPVDQPDHARRAVAAALRMESEVEALNVEFQKLGEPLLEIGIGIDSGEVIAGNVGSADRREYTVIGDTVNRSSRIEQLNKSFQARILVSERTYRESKLGAGRELPPITVKGIAEPLRVFAVGAKA